jgi:hypothetical protein
MLCTIRYGVDSINKSYDVAPKISQLADDSLRAALGFGDNVQFLIGGVAQPNNAVVPDGAVVTVETTANQKA